MNVTGGPSLTLHEVNAAIALITDVAHEDANVIFGYVVDEELGDEVAITVIATGFDRAVPRATTMEERPQQLPVVHAQPVPGELATHSDHSEQVHAEQDRHQQLHLQRVEDVPAGVAYFRVRLVVEVEPRELLPSHPQLLADRVLCGQIEPDHGQVILAPQTNVSMLEQDVPVELTGSTQDIVAAGLSDFDEHEDEAPWVSQQRVEQILSRMDLDPAARFEVLSSGMKRRVLLAHGTAALLRAATTAWRCSAARRPRCPACTRAVTSS